MRSTALLFCLFIHIASNAQNHFYKLTIQIFENIETGNSIDGVSISSVDDFQPQQDLGSGKYQLTFIDKIPGETVHLHFSKKGYDVISTDKLELTLSNTHHIIVLLSNNPENVYQQRVDYYSKKYLISPTINKDADAGKTETAFSKQAKQKATKPKSDLFSQGETIKRLAKTAASMDAGKNLGDEQIARNMREGNFIAARNLIAEQIQQRSEKINTIKAGISKENDTLAYQLAVAGDLSSAGSDIDSAIYYYRLAVQIKSNQIYNLYNLSQLLIQHGDYDEAYDMAAAAINTIPQTDNERLIQIILKISFNPQFRVAYDSAKINSKEIDKLGVDENNAASLGLNLIDMAISKLNILPPDSMLNTILGVEQLGISDNLLLANFYFVVGSNLLLHYKTYFQAMLCFSKADSLSRDNLDNEANLLARLSMLIESDNGFKDDEDSFDAQDYVDSMENIAEDSLYQLSIHACRSVAKQEFDNNKVKFSLIQLLYGYYEFLHSNQSDSSENAHSKMPLKNLDSTGSAMTNEAMGLMVEILKSNLTPYPIKTFFNFLNALDDQISPLIYNFGIVYKYLVEKIKPLANTKYYNYFLTYATATLGGDAPDEKVRMSAYADAIKYGKKYFANNSEPLIDSFLILYSNSVRYYVQSLDDHSAESGFLHLNIPYFEQRNVGGKFDLILSVLYPESFTLETKNNDVSKSTLDSLSKQTLYYYDKSLEKYPDQTVEPFVDFLDFATNYYQAKKNYVGAYFYKQVGLDFYKSIVLDDGSGLNCKVLAINGILGLAKVVMQFTDVRTAVKTIDSILVDFKEHTSNPASYKLTVFYLLTNIVAVDPTNFTYEFEYTDSRFDSTVILPWSKLFDNYLPLFNNDPAMKMKIEKRKSKALKKPMDLVLTQVLKSLDLDEALQMYVTLRKDSPNNYLFSEDDLNVLGYSFLKQGKLNDAIKIFKLNVEEFPGSWNVYDSLGEGYLKNGERDKGLANYKHALSLNPGNADETRIIRQIELNH